MGCIHPHSASRSPNIFQWPADIASRLQLLIALLISVARDSHDVHGMFGMCLLSASSANRFTGAYHGFDHAHSAGWPFGHLFIENIPTSPSYTGVYRYESCIPPSHTVLSCSSLVQHLFLAGGLDPTTSGPSPPPPLKWSPLPDILGWTRG